MSLSSLKRRHYLGNEKEGVSQQAREMSDYNVHIPALGMTQSLNISVVWPFACIVSNSALCKLDIPEQNKQLAELFVKNYKSPHILIEHLLTKGESRGKS